jgi:hypothetical protein
MKNSLRRESWSVLGSQQRFDFFYIGMPEAGLSSDSLAAGSDLSAAARMENIRCEFARRAGARRRRVNRAERMSDIEVKPRRPAAREPAK